MTRLTFWQLFYLLRLRVEFLCPIEHSVTFNGIENSRMCAQRIDANSGVEALLGFEFQRNCALILILDNYDDFIDEDYFVSIEHYDDFLFCFRKGDSHGIDYIQSYQAKKLSGAKWSINKRLSETISKMLEVGLELNKDEATIKNGLNKELIFISNSPIELKSDDLTPKKPGVKPKPQPTFEVELLKENNTSVAFSSLHQSIQEKLIRSVNSFDSNKKYEKSAFIDLKFNYISMLNGARNQKIQLAGVMATNFRNIPDPNAAIEVLLCLFREVETVYNQRNVISLMDASKTIEGDKIRQTLDIIDLEKRTFKFWRENATEFCKKLKISRGDSAKAEEYIGIAFELFKDKEQSEHRYIFEYVSNQNFEFLTYTDEDCIQKFMAGYKKNRSTHLDDIDLCFAIVCAYVQTRNIS